MGKKIVPFGLRLKLFPHFKNPSPDFKTQWEKALTACSLSLMNLLITEHKNEMAQIDNELQPLNLKWTTLKNSVGLGDKEKNLTENLEKT